MSELATACPLDCPDLCRLNVDVVDGRVVSVAGANVPFTDGLICSKVRKFAAHMYGPERILQPHVRREGHKEHELVPTTWSHALDVIEARLRATRDAHGAASILPFHYGGSNGWLTEGALATRFFRRLGASNLARTYCAAATTTATRGLYGKMAGVPLPDYEHAKLIVVWGQNPHATSIHLVPIIERALVGGAQLIVVDPRRTSLAKKAHVHIAPRPGTDLPLALALANVFFARGWADEQFLAAHALGVEAYRRRAADWPVARAAHVCDVPAADIEAMAERYRAATPAVIRCGWGVERNRHGGSAVAAILALPAIAGKFGVRAGGYTLSNGDVAWGVDAESAIAEPPTNVRSINMSLLGPALDAADKATDAAAQPPVRAVFVYNANPVATAPDQQAVLRHLTSSDRFVVVHDAVWTDTARVADVVLPATTFMEHRDLRRGYGNVVMYDAAPVATPVGGSRSNNQLFGELLQRFDLVRPTDPMTDDELVAAIMAKSPHGAALAEAARAGGARPPGGEHVVQLGTVWPSTPSGKIELDADTLRAEAGDRFLTYTASTSTLPLTLISPALSTQVSSTFGQLRTAPVTLSMARVDAAARGLRSGDAVRVYNELGEVHVDVTVSDDLRAGVVTLPKGAWRRHTANGLTANALIPAVTADLGGQAAYHEARVEVARR